MFFTCVSVDGFVSFSDEMSVGRKEAFETFRRDYAQNDTIEENKQTLKQRLMSSRVLVCGPKTFRCFESHSFSLIFVASPRLDDNVKHTIHGKRSEVSFPRPFFSICIPYVFNGNFFFLQICGSQETWGTS